MAPDRYAGPSVQSASARLHPRAFGMGGGSLSGVGEVRISSFLVAEASLELMDNPSAETHVRFWG